MAQDSRSGKHPNLLIVLADQMRGQAMGCMGDAEAITPNLDSLAKEGVMFTNAISTYPLCCPARAMLLTGRYPLTNRVITNGPPLPEEEVSIGDVLKKAGYDTGYIGKWHLNGHDAQAYQFVPPGPKRHGFDYWASTNFVHDYFNSFYYRDTDEKISVVGWEPDAQTDLAIQFMEEHKGGPPFCLFLSWGPPHDPYVAPKEFQKLHSPDSIKLRENVFLGDNKIIAAYYAAITSLDWNVGRLMEAIDRLGLGDDTMVVFTSDHGDMLFSLYLFHKQWPYEESILVPLIIRYPRRVKNGKVSDVLIGTADIMPTLLGLCDVQIPDCVEGRDLSSIILGSHTEKEPDSVLIEVINPCAVVQDRMGMRAWRGVRTERYTYARFKNEDWILIDNKYDPFQRRNLVYNSEYNALKNDLRSRLDEWLEKTNDPFLPMSAYQRFEMVNNRPPLWNNEAGNRST